jgi:hypothetical protein
MAKNEPRSRSEVAHAETDDAGNGADHNQDRHGSG